EIDPREPRPVVRVAPAPPKAEDSDPGVVPAEPEPRRPEPTTKSAPIPEPVVEAAPRRPAPTPKGTPIPEVEPPRTPAPTPSPRMPAPTPAPSKFVPAAASAAPSSPDADLPALRRPGDVDPVPAAVAGSDKGVWADPTEGV